MLNNVHRAYFFILLKLSFASVSAAMVSAGPFFHAKTFSALLLTSGNTEFAAITVCYALRVSLDYLIDIKLWTGMEWNRCHM